MQEVTRLKNRSEKKDKALERLQSTLKLVKEKQKAIDNKIKNLAYKKAAELEEIKENEMLPQTSKKIIAKR